MEEQNMFLWIKAAVTALCAAFSAAFGWLGWLVLAWAVCMVIDWISGSAAAASKGEWSSAVARAGIWHKAGMVVVVIVAAMADGVLGVAVENLPVLGIQYTVLILPVVLVWYIFTELGSIAENAAAMGAPVPEGLIKLLAAGKRAAEKCVPDTDTDEKIVNKTRKRRAALCFGAARRFFACAERWKTEEIVPYLYRFTYRLTRAYTTF